MNNQKVWIPNEPLRRDPDTGDWIRSFNLRPAQQFGELVFLMPSNGLMIPIDSANIIDRLWKALEDYDKDNDYFLPVGSPVVGALTIGIISQLTGGQFNLLLWDNAAHIYNVVRANIGTASLME